MMTAARGWFLALATLFSGVAYADRDYDDVFKCESKDREPSYCRTETRGDVVLVRQLSKKPCIEGNTWGNDRRGVWVSGGCRAEFAVVSRYGRDRGYNDDRAYDRARDNDRGYQRDRGLPDPNDRGGRGGSQLVKCESRDRDYNHCNVRVRGRVELSRQLSDTRCVYGQTWGSDRDGVWVRGGCRGEFVIYD